MAKKFTLAGLITLKDEASKKLQAIDGHLQKVKKSAQDFGQGFQQFGQGLTAIGAAGTGVSVGMGLSLKQFADFESALIGVGKTTDIQGAPLRELGMRFEDISKSIPVSSKALLELGQVAGQLGVKGADNLVNFSTTLAKLASATDVVGPEGAASISRILTVTGDGVEKVATFGAVLVDLGNKFAATESEILSVANEVSKAGVQFNVGSTDVLGMSTAMKAVGLNAESAGTSLFKTFKSLDQFSREGGVGLQALSKITGIAPKNFRKEFEANATDVLAKFVEGLGKVGEAGGDINKVLEAFQLGDIRATKLLGTLAKQPDVMRRALKVAREQSKVGNALDEEADRAFKSLNNRFQILLNRIAAFANRFGEFFSKLLDGPFERISAFAGILGDAFLATGQSGDKLQDTINSLAKSSGLTAEEVKGLIDFMKGLKDGTIEAFNTMKDVAKSALETFKQFFPKVAQSREELGRLIGKVLVFAATWGPVILAVGGVLMAVGQMAFAFIGFFGMIKSGTSIMLTLLSAFSKILGITQLAALLLMGKFLLALGAIAIFAYGIWQIFKNWDFLVSNVGAAFHGLLLTIQEIMRSGFGTFLSVALSPVRAFLTPLLELVRFLASTSLGKNLLGEGIAKSIEDISGRMSIFGTFRKGGWLGESDDAPNTVPVDEAAMEKARQRIVALRGDNQRMLAAPSAMEPNMSVNVQAGKTEATIHNHVFLDGKEVGRNIQKQMMTVHERSGMSMNSQDRQAFQRDGMLPPVTQRSGGR